jgi:DNA-binding transcriptional LysR family regulator
MLDALTLDQLRVLVAIADQGSFRAAGTYLSRAQSSISHAVASVEAELGVTLFDRSYRKPVLTNEGQALLADARAVLIKVDLMKARTKGLGSQVELELAIAVDPQFPIEMIAKSLATLGAEYPTVAVRVISTSLGGPLNALDKGECNLAIAGDAVTLPGIVLQALCYVVRAALVSPRHPLAHITQSGTMLQLEHLTDHVQAVVRDPSALTDGQSYNVLSPRTWYASDNAMKHALILSGACWGSLPLWMVQNDLETGRLQKLPVLEFGAKGETEIRLYVAHRSRQALGPAATRLRELLLQQATSDRYIRT